MRRCVTTRNAAKRTNTARVTTTTTDASTDRCKQRCDTLPIAFTNETEKVANSDCTFALTTKGLKQMPQVQAHNQDAAHICSSGRQQILQQ
jgi:hypothetical protein